MVSVSGHRLRVLVFMDYSNFRPSMEGTEAGFQIDLRPLGQCLANAALATVDPTAGLDFQGMRMYGSYDPYSKAGRSQQDWYSNFASGVPGVYVTAVARRRKRSGPTCPDCYDEIRDCPACGNNMLGTEEKGVDTRIATDLLSMGWGDQYDVAVLVSPDRDFIPVVEFLETRSIKVVHGAFQSVAAELSQACWANIDVSSLREQFRRAV